MKLKFEKDEYIKFLKRSFTEISSELEYNIFCHCVTSHTRYFFTANNDKENEIELKINNIMRMGLNLDGLQAFGRYGSINGTARFFGDAKSADLEKIANYDFFSYSPIIHTFVLALPKYLNINGEDIEFSSYNGKMGDASQHTKNCVFDLIKKTYLPVEFIYGYQRYDTNTGEYTFIENDKHFSKISDNERDYIMDIYADRFEKLVEYSNKKHHVETLEELFSVMTSEHAKTIEDCVNMP